MASTVPGSAPSEEIAYTPIPGVDHRPKADDDAQAIDLVFVRGEQRAMTLDLIMRGRTNLLVALRNLGDNAEEPAVRTIADDVLKFVNVMPFMDQTADTESNILAFVRGGFWEEISGMSPLEAIDYLAGHIDSESSIVYLDSLKKRIVEMKREHQAKKQGETTA